MDNKIWKDKAQNTVEQLSDTADNTMQTVREAGGQIKQSGKEWFSYIQTHPLQTMLFGIIGYFALKGIIKD